MANRHQDYELRQYQSLPLHAKIAMTKQRIREWYDYWDGDVYISFSGGKDSTVLLDIVRSMYANVPAVFCDTGLEYPEIRRFALSHENVTVLKPKMRFPEIIREYGYPLISKEVAEAIYYARRIGGRTAIRRKNELEGTRVYWETQTNEHLDSPPEENESERTHGRETIRKRTEFDGGRVYQTGVITKKSAYNKDKYLPIVYLPIPISHYCCNVMKKLPAKQYARQNKVHPIIGTLAEESILRRQAWLRHGCNAFDSANPTSQPMSFWTEQDVLQYITEHNLPICSVYGDIIPADDQMNLDGDCKLKCSGCPRTGCVWCAFGAQHDKESRYLRLKQTHPLLYDYCMRGGQWIDNPAYDPDAPEYDGEWKNWNPEKIWVPSSNGLGMAKVFEMVNEVMGKEFIKY